MERRTAHICRELDKYNIDIAALSETRFHDEGHIEEVAARLHNLLEGRAHHRNASIGRRVPHQVVASQQIGSYATVSE